MVPSRRQPVGCSRLATLTPDSPGEHLPSGDLRRSPSATFCRWGASVAIPTFPNQRGHPVLIGRGLFGELLILDPGQGANTIVCKYRDATQFVEVGDEGILIDVDNPDAYRRCREA